MHNSDCAVRHKWIVEMSVSDHKFDSRRKYAL